MKIHLLRPDSVTPIATYLARSAGAASVWGPQLDLAIALLYRELEYAAMYWSALGPPPVPASGSPFHPYDLTPAGAEWRARQLGQGPTADLATVAATPFDLFGLKADAATRLAASLRPVAAQRFGWAVAAQLFLDLCRWDEAVEAAERAADLGAAPFGLALAQTAALSGAFAHAGGVPASGRRAGSERRANAIRARARREGIVTDSGWPHRVLSREWQGWLHRAGVRVRRRVEGEAFARFVTTEAAFCESERAAALATFDIDRVPPELRALEDLARAIGVGDDPCRGLFVRRMSASARRTAAARIRALDARIQAWLGTLPQPYEAEAAAYYWLSVAAEDLAGGR